MLLQYLPLPILLKHPIYPSCSPSNPYPLYSLTVFVCIYMYVYICISKYILFSLYNVICRYVFILVITEFSEHSSLKKFIIYESYKHVFVCVYNASFCLIVFRFFETRCLYIVLAVLELTRWPGWLHTKTSTWFYLRSGEIKGTHQHTYSVSHFGWYNLQQRMHLNYYIIHCLCFGFRSNQ